MKNFTALLLLGFVSAPAFASSLHISCTYYGKDKTTVCADTITTETLAKRPTAEISLSDSKLCDMGKYDLKYAYQGNANTGIVMVTITKQAQILFVHTVKKLEESGFSLMNGVKMSRHFQRITPLNGHSHGIDCSIDTVDQNQTDQN